VLAEAMLVLEEDERVNARLGTYALALAAHHAGIPMLVVAPESTWDASLATGAQIVIEECSAEEVTHVRGRTISPAGSDAYNPAFDVTPAALITAIVTEDRVFRLAGRQTCDRGTHDPKRR
jgi:methylthioribose-1-phosphate isomerase